LILKEVERNILLAGEQVGRTHLCPQTAPHHVLQEAGASNGGTLVELHDTFEQGAETQRIDTRPHQREELPALAIKLHVDIDDRAQLEAPEIDGRPDLQTAYGLMEVELDENRVAVGVGHGLDLIVVQLEHRVGHCRFVVEFVGGRERHPAGQHGRERTGLNRYAVGIEIDVDAARIPEPCVHGHKAVLWCIDKDLDVHGPPGLVERIAYDLPHLNSPEIDGRANVERTQVVGFEHVAGSWLFTGNLRRLL